MKTIDIVKLKETFRLNGNLELERKNKVSGRWHIVKNKANFYKGYCQVAFNGTMCFYHRILWCIYYGEDIKQGEIIDHKDGNRTNNKPGNLRLCNTYQNSYNRKLQSNNKTGYKGVSWNNGKKKYIAQIQENGKKHFLGYYLSVLEAYASYCKASKKYHGEYGRVN
jgi:hypothetical protein